MPSDKKHKKDKNKKVKKDKKDKKVKKEWTWRRGKMEGNIIQIVYQSY